MKRLRWSTKPKEILRNLQKKSYFVMAAENIAET